MAVLEALKRCVAKWEFSEVATGAISGGRPTAAEDCLLYLISPRLGGWTTIVEAHFSINGAPWLPELALDLSNDLKTHALTLMVHDDDVFFYNLCHNGADLDGYNSCPQYFEQERLSDAKVLEQRHDCVPFASLLPEGVSLSQLEEILKRGWWAAYLGGRLDDDGVISADEPSYVFEGERMTDIGNLLQLHGGTSGYPFAGWAHDPNINWSSFVALNCQRTKTHSADHGRPDH